MSPRNSRRFNSSRFSSCLVAAFVVTTFCAVLVPAAFAAQVNFQPTGEEQTWNVPAGVFSLQVEAAGGRGATGQADQGVGGVGGVVTATLGVYPGEPLFVEVGGNGGATSGGFNGGGTGSQ
jgi:hypothetical protein